MAAKNRVVATCFRSIGISSLVRLRDGQSGDKNTPVEELEKIQKVVAKFE
jgi:hypothetical protein